MISKVFHTTLEKAIWI